MKYLSISSVLFLLAFTPVNQVQNDNWEEIKTSKEIKDFETYLFHFPITDHFREAVKQIAILSETAPEMEVKSRNYIEVLVNEDGQILFNQDFMFNGLDGAITDYIDNTTNSQNKPEQVKISVPDAGEKKVSKFFVSVQTLCEDASKMQVILKDISSGVKAYKDILSKEWYGENTSAILPTHKKFMNQLFEDCIYYSNVLNPSRKTRFVVSY
jgi:hypothetical protein